MQNGLQGEDEMLAATQCYSVGAICYTSSEQLSYEDNILGAETNPSPQCFPCFPSCKRPLHQDLMECQNYAFISRCHLPSTFANSSLATPVSSETERVVKVYYMRVLTRRGVAIFEDAEGELEPPPKRISIAKLTFPEGIPPKVILPGDTQHLLTDSKAHWDSEVLEGGEEAERASEMVAEEAGPSAGAPPWLLHLERGFRCMGCCRVFPTLEILTKHVEHGLKEGFSCLTFHLAFARLRRKRKKERRRITKNGQWCY
ncbi:PREDICTED: protein FAM170A-like isoform X2 [Chinchilla lanigera]|nr:PREDICTED: protein FAM170A-like isoform X2 [Chinchilla lanigera]